MTGRPNFRTSSAFVLAVLLVLALVAVISVGSVVTTSTAQDAVESAATSTTDSAIEIEACREITTSGDYELIDNISPGDEDDLALDPEEYSDNACIAINASGVTLDGQGYTINGSAFYDEDNNPEHSGVLVQNLSEDAGINEESELLATVTNLSVEEWRYGINFYVADSPTVTDSTVRSDIPFQSGINVEYSDYATFERNYINTSLSVGIAVEESDNVTVHNNTINPSWGVATTGDYTTITENEFTNFSQAAVQLGLIERGAIIQDGGPATNVSIENNYFDAGTEAGSAVLGYFKSDSPVIRNNTMYGTHGQLSGSAVYLGRYSVNEDPDDGANYSVIRNNTVDGFTNGLHVERGGYASEIVDNVVTNTHNAGIQLFAPGTDDGVITGNNVTGADGPGISLRSVDNASVYDNVASDNAIGLDLYNSTSSAIYDNDFSRSGTRDDAVVRVDDDLHNTVVRNNNLSNGPGIGVEISHVDGLTLVDNEISDNHNEGIEISAFAARQATNLTIEGNNITRNRLDGIVDESSNGTVYADNYVADNEGGTNVKGILVTDDASNVTIRGNTIENHEDNGIEIDSGGSFEVTNNTIRNNKIESLIGASFSAGVDVVAASSGTIEENDIEDNEFGVRVQVDAENISIVHNSFDLHPENATEYDIEDPEHVLNATFNYWGADNGPSGGAQDPVTGEYAVGDGDGVDENVSFDPWGGKPAEFELSNFLVSSTELETGEEFFVSTNVTNVGGEFDVETVRLKYDGEEVTNESVALDPGERTTVTFVVDAPDQEGEYNLTVETTDDLFSETINATEPEPATFELTNFLVSSTDLETGEEFFVSTNVTNTGEEVDVETVRLKYDGVEVTNESVALDPDERTTVTFVVDAPDEEGEYNLTVETTDDLFSETLNVTEPEPATFEITRFDLFSTKLDTGEEFFVSTNITNTGEESGVDTARLKFDGVEATNESVALEPGERETVNFAVDAPEDPGEYTVSVETADDQAAGEITVGPNFQIIDADMPTDVDQGDNVTVEFIIENTGSHGTQPVNFTVYAPEQDDDGDDGGDDEEALIDASVAVVEDSRNTTQGEAYVEILENQFETVDLLTNETVLDEMADYDVFVVYRFVTDAQTEDFHEELGDEQGVVYLDDAPRSTTERWADGVFRLNRVYDDPGHWEHVALDADADPPELNVTADHPIFDGVGEVGETAILNENTEDTTWGSWFEDYSGDVLAEVDYAASDPEQWGGPGVGVDDSENEVMLAALIHDNLLEHITPEGEALIVNAVAHVGPEVDGTGHTAATETNDSDGGDDEFPFYEQEVIHVWDELTLETGETTTIELEYEVPENLAPDRYTQELSTENDSVISELWVELHADIEVTSYSLDPNPAEETLAVGDTLTAEAVVANHGERPGEFEVEYIVDEGVVANETVEVDAETTEVVQLDQELRETGTKIISVNGVDPVQIFVESGVEPPFFDVTELSPSNLTVGPEAPVTAGANITNIGADEGSTTVELRLDGEMVQDESLVLGPDEMSSVSWDIDAPDEPGAYNLTVSTEDDEATATLTVDVPDPIGDFGEPQDTTGDGLYNDVTGSGNFTIADVQALFDNLHSDAVQENAWAFDFAGVNNDRVSVFDVQALFTQLS